MRSPNKLIYLLHLETGISSLFAFLDIMSLRSMKSCIKAPRFSFSGLSDLTNYPSLFGYYRCKVFIQILSLKYTLSKFSQIWCGSHILALAPQILTRGATVAPLFQGVALSEIYQTFLVKHDIWTEKAVNMAHNDQLKLCTES